ncbi:hypothetical protein ON058_04765 [Demequina sp. B12]|uniref:hypothetical protein n=1 Tax=Demequina sp. B12 TaxID=2992757 RepID=UPI00237A19FC|nr:hypothetical protein [Demequina sp. B12]MDE0572726.1 hypothetical protein [Demequina sp. B12]
MYRERYESRGRPPEARRNLQDLLRLTLAAVEIAGTRREAMDAVADSIQAPGSLATYRHDVYETTVVYEFGQLARQDFESHGNVAVWERPLTWTRPGGTYASSGHIDISLFNSRRQVETRIEFGKAEPRPRARPPRDEKLESDALKLHDARNDFASRRADADAPRGYASENYVVLWDLRDSRKTKSTARPTKKAFDSWFDRCSAHARAASGRLGFDVVLETAAASDMMSFKADVRRGAYAAIFQVLP